MYSVTSLCNTCESDLLTVAAGTIATVALITDAHVVISAAFTSRVDVTDVAITTTVGDDGARDAVALVATATHAAVILRADVVAAVGVGIAVVHLVTLCLCKKKKN